MTDNVVIALSCGTDNPNRSARAFHLATIAHKEGKNVTVFLLDEGVYLGKQGLADNLKAATGDVADDLIAYLQAHEVHRAVRAVPPPRRAGESQRGSPPPRAPGSTGWG